MPVTMGDAVVYLVADNKQLKKGFKKADKQVKSFAKKTSEVLGKAFLVGMGAAAAATGALMAAKKAFDMSKQGAELLRLQRAGEQLASTFGQSMDDIVESIQRGSQGTISKMDAIEVANKGLMLGVAKTPAEFEKLTKSALALGQAMGRGPLDAINDITTGIGRMSPLILDNLGIMTGGGKVFEEYAEAHGLIAENLTDAEKKQALLNTSLESAIPLFNEAGEVVLDTAGEYEQLEAQIADLTDEFKIQAAEVGGPVVSALTAAMVMAREFGVAIEEFGYKGARVGRHGMVILADGTKITKEEFLALVDEWRETARVAESADATFLHSAGLISGIGDAAGYASGQLDGLEEAFDVMTQVRGGIENAGVALNRFLQEGGGVGKIEAPKDYVAESPSPLEKGIRGAAKALELELNPQFGELTKELQASLGGGGNTYTTSNDNRRYFEGASLDLPSENMVEVLAKELRRMG